MQACARVHRVLHQTGSQRLFAEREISEHACAISKTTQLGAKLGNADERHEIYPKPNFAGHDGRPGDDISVSF